MLALYVKVAWSPKVSHCFSLSPMSAKWGGDDAVDGDPRVECGYIDLI